MSSPANEIRTRVQTGSVPSTGATEGGSKNPPSVGVVVVNYNLKDSLRATLQSIQQVNYPAFSIVVCDNASKDGSQEMVRREFPDVHLIANPKELGYAKAASLGMEYMAPRHPYIFSTTNDVTLAPDIFTVLVEAAEKDPALGVIGTKIFFYDRPTVLWHAGAKVHWFHGHSFHYGYNQDDQPRFDQVRECAYVTGCGVLLRSALVQRIGGFKEDLVFYFEDADLCLRAWEAGSRVIYLPAAKMWHKTSTTLARNRSLQLRYSTRNNLYFLQRHQPRIGGSWPTHWTYVWLTCPLKMAYFCLWGQWKNAVGIWRGIQDWRQGKYGMIGS